MKLVSEVRRLTGIPGTDACVRPHMSTHVIFEGTPGVYAETGSVIVEGAHLADVVDAARRAAVDAETIELCGAVPVEVAAEVIRSVGDAAEVRVNRYGFESLEAAAAYKAAFSTGGDPGDAAFFFLAEAPTEITQRDGVIVAGVADMSDLRDRAAQALKLGAGIVELYGGLGVVAAAEVRAATKSRLPVGYID